MKTSPCATSTSSWNALLTPPRPDAHNNSRHFYESARAIVAGYMAWVRFKAPPELCTLAKVYEMLSMPPKQRESFADRVRDMNRFAGGLTHIAIERQAQVGKEEGGSRFYEGRQPALIPQLPPRFSPIRKAPASTP